MMSKTKKEILSAWTFGNGLRLMTFKGEDKDVSGTVEGPNGFSIELPKDKAVLAAKGYTSAKSNDELRRYLDDVEKNFNMFKKSKK